MRQVREVLRLKFVGGVPTREIARRIGVAASTVRATIKRFQAASLDWPLPDGLTDGAPRRGCSPMPARSGVAGVWSTNWTSIHRELKRKHATLSILWDECPLPKAAIHDVKDHYPAGPVFDQTRVLCFMNT
jgi:Sigma-70, region 4